MRRFLLCILFAMVLLPASGQLDKRYFFHMGRELLIDNRYREAVQTLGVLLKVDPEAYEGYLLRGIAKYNLDDLIGAEADFTAAIQTNPVYTQAYTNRAIVRSRMGKYDDALRDFQEAIALRPDLPGAYYSRGYTRLMNRQLREAIEDFDHFLLREGRVVDAYLNRGMAYLQLGDTLRAEVDFEQGIRTNRDDPRGYIRRGTLYMEQGRNAEALADFDRAVRNDTLFPVSYFSRAILHARTQQPAAAISDLDRVIALDSTDALGWFNRAIIRSQIGDYNRALEDYNRVAELTPDNVLLHYNRAQLHATLGHTAEAIADYTRAIELYPDFANAYLQRASLRFLQRDDKGARQDRATANRKITEYRSRLSDTTALAIFADTAMNRFNRLVSFDSKDAQAYFRSAQQAGRSLTLLPLLKFTFLNPDPTPVVDPQRYFVQRMEDFMHQVDFPLLSLSRLSSDIPPDSLLQLDARFAAHDDWPHLFLRGISQSLIRQYTSAIASYQAAIERAPSNPFLYLNLSATRSEMIDFISSIGSGFQRISVEPDPASRMINNSTRSYNYDEALGELNQAARLMPDFAPIYYNRAGLLALSGKLPEALEQYTRALELNPNFAEAYYNRGLVQIYLGDSNKGYLDISKAGELGVAEAYEILKRQTD